MTENTKNILENKVHIKFLISITRTSIMGFKRYKDALGLNRHAQHDCNLTEVKNSDRLYGRLQRKLCYSTYRDKCLLVSL